MRTWFALLLLLAVAGLAAFTWQWIAADPGYLLIRYGATSIETSLVFAIVAVALFALLLRIAWRLLRAPAAAWSRQRRRRGRERIARGLVALAEGRYTHALRELERASHLGALQAPALLAAARAAQARGDAERANSLLARAPAAAAVVLRARFELERRRPDAALALLKAHDAPLPPAGWQLLAESALRAGNPASALAALAPLARTQALAPGDYARLEQRVLAAALAAAPDRDRLGELWAGLSKAQRRRPEAVVAYARRAAELGQVLAAMGELESALGRSWSEDLIVVYGELGPADAEARLRFAEGCIAAQPNSAGLALALGRLCIQCKLWGKARGYLERGLELEPAPALWEALGDCAAAQGDAATASRCYANTLRAARGEAVGALAIAAGATALSTRAAVVEERSEHGVPRLPGAVSR